MDACSAGNATAIEYLNKRIEKIDNQKKELNQRILDIRQESDNVINLYDGIDIDNVPEIILNGSFEDKKGLCKLFVKVVKYTSPEDIEIEYNI